MKKIILALFVLGSYNVCISQSTKQMEERLETAAIPKDILNKEYVLLVKIPFSTKTWVTKFTKVMEENYSGSFEIVPFDTKIDETYPDVKKYKYIVAISHGLSKKDYSPANYELLKEEREGPLLGWSKYMFLVNRQKLLSYEDTGLNSQDDQKILGFYVGKLSGK